MGLRQDTVKAVAAGFTSVAEATRYEMETQMIGSMDEMDLNLQYAEKWCDELPVEDKLNLLQESVDDVLNQTYDVYDIKQMVYGILQQVNQLTRQLDEVLVTRHNEQPTGEMLTDGYVHSTGDGC